MNYHSILYIFSCSHEEPLCMEAHIDVIAWLIFLAVHCTPLNAAMKDSLRNLICVVGRFWRPPKARTYTETSLNTKPTHGGRLHE